jgi:hypothetical protein
MNKPVALGLATMVQMPYAIKRLKRSHVLGGLASHRMRLRMMTCLQIQNVLREDQAEMRGEYSHGLLLNWTM